MTDLSLDEFTADATAFLDANVDALFSDNPDIAVAVRDTWVAASA